ncbi:MAG: hypothetical protein JSV80_11150 [Acidobacteriota bacterium]|nr:MAG: hypothetical protein JSV80_11150 [Acidobacteriota bacterium]
MTETATAPVQPEIGEPLAGGWRVERLLGEHERILAVLAQGDAGARALCFVLPADSPDPELDDTVAAGWGSTRVVLRDERWGRVVVDEIGEGPLLCDRLQRGSIPPQAWMDELRRRVNAQHRRGALHGQLRPELIAISPGGPQIGGWGLVAASAEELEAIDATALAQIAGAAGEGSAEQRGPALRAAIVSDHLPTLRRAIEQHQLSQGSDAWRGSTSDKDLARALDALTRIEQKVATQLAEARHRLDEGDPLGAVAACREAIRLGAEDEAEPLLRQARRQARRMLNRRGLAVSARGWIVGAAALVVLAACGFALLVAGGRSNGEPSLESVVARHAAAGGPRAAVRALLSLYERGELPPSGHDLLSEQLRQLASSERQRLVELRRDAVAQGARPRAADPLAEQALDEMDGLAREFQPSGLAGRLTQALSHVDRAASLYRASLGLSPEEAMRAVEQLILDDRVFTEQE